MYLEFYGLAEGPFGLTPDPKYLFLSVGHKEALAHIHYGIEERRGFVLILGEVGTGKTTLIRHVLKRFGPDVKSVFLFNSSLGFEELLQAVLRDLEVPSPSHRRVDLIDALNEFLLQESQEGRRVVLIIDEAQNLSASVLEEIRMLSNLETARSKLLQIVLVGQPELGERLGQVSLRQLRQRIGLVAELKPLSRKDSVLYVKHRLKVAGARENIFTPLALRSVYRTSNGIPRLINVLCDKSLVLGYASNKKRIGRRIVETRGRGLGRVPHSRPPGVGDLPTTGSRASTSSTASHADGRGGGGWDPRRDRAPGGTPRDTGPDGDRRRRPELGRHELAASGRPCGIRARAASLADRHTIRGRADDQLSNHQDRSGHGSAGGRSLSDAPRRGGALGGARPAGKAGCIRRDGEDG